MTYDQEARARLAAAVTSARKRKFRTVEAARNSVDPPISRGAWDKVEGGASVKDFTLSAVETALGWAEGEAARILAGGDGFVAEVESSNLSESMKKWVLDRYASEQEHPSTEPKEGVTGA